MSFACLLCLRNGGRALYDLFGLGWVVKSRLPDQCQFNGYCWVEELNKSSICCYFFYLPYFYLLPDWGSRHSDYLSLAQVVCLITVVYHTNNTHFSHSLLSTKVLAGKARTGELFYEGVIMRLVVTPENIFPLKLVLLCITCDRTMIASCDATLQLHCDGLHVM